MKKLLLISFLFFLVQATFAQTKTISGTIKNNADGIPIPGATVLIKGTTKSSVTDMDGKYLINASPTDVLVFSYMGFTTKELKATGSTINVSLEESVESLKEVTVTTSFGIKRAKASLGYATQSVKGEDLADTQRENFANALQGRIAGLTVTSTSGAPGASAAIQLRGVNSMSGNNQPLFVVDGLPISNNTLDQGLLISNAPNRNADYNSRGADINPDDIESITVLKGPEAAALYGIEAGNGAIVITTKKGKKGRGTITFSTDVRFDDVYRFPETQKVYQRGASGITNNNYRRYFGEKYAPGTQMFDNINNFFQTGIKKSNSLTLDAGSETLTYRLSVANLEQGGVIPNSAYEKLNLTLGGTAKITDKLRAEASVAFVKSKTDKASKGAGGFLLNLLSFPSDIDVRDYVNTDGSRKKITDGSLDTEADNPFFNVNKNKATDENARVITNASLTYDPLSWLSFTGRFGVDANSTQGFRSSHPESQEAGASGGYYEQYTDQTKNYNFLFFGTAKQSLGKFNGLLRLGTARKLDNYVVLSSKGEKFYVADATSINNTDPTTQRSLERIIKKRVDGIFGEFTLDYDKLLYLTLTGRNDVSSTLPRDNNSFFYPSASMSFVFSELNALKDNEILSFGKIRTSWARVANDARPYSIAPAYEPKTTTGGGFGYSVTGANPALQAEMNTSTEIGTELRFFKNRFGLDVALYERRTDNPIINGMRLSYGTGFVLTAYNFGSLKNRGIEVTFTGAPIKSENFTWDILANFTKTDSELLSLPSTLPEFYTSDTWMYGNVRGGARVGSPLTTFTGYTNIRNKNGDILINPSTGQPLIDTNFPIVGDRNPDFSVGLQNSFTLRNFKLSFLLDIRKGGDIYNATEAYLFNQGLSTQTVNREQPIVINGVIKDGLEDSPTPTKNNIQITPYFQNDYYNSNTVSSDFIERDVNWLRMRDITLSYRFSPELIQKSKLFQSMAMYLTVTDAFMITNYKGADPAVNGLNASSGGAGGTGFDYGVLSTSRGVNLGFKFGL